MALSLVETGDTHYEVGGTRYPRVTSVLAGVGISPRFPVGVPAVDLARAQGTETHALAHEWDTYGEVLSAHEHPCTLARLDAWRAWCADVGAATLLSEQFLYTAGPHGGFAGTVDRVMRLRDGSTAVVDLKRTVKPYAAIQLAAYATLLTVNFSGQIAQRIKCIPVDVRRIAVGLGADGVPQPVEYPVENLGRDQDVFFGALAVARWKEHGQWE